MAVDILRTVFALVFILGLLWLLGYALRKYGSRLGLPTPMNPGRTRRLQLVEVLPLDTRNKLMIIRRDDREHLILVGAEQSHVIEQNIPSAPQEKS